MKLVDWLLCKIGLHRIEYYVLGYYVCVSCENWRKAFETEI